jgi:hypothetical protein
MARILSLFAGVLVLWAPAVSADPSKDDLAAFKQYLEKNFKGKKWQTGPTILESKELEKAYPGKRFLFVYSSPPLPPGAFLPELIERHRQASEDFRKNYISLTVVKDKDGFRALGKPESYQEGLMAVKNDDDAKVAATAIISLHSSSGIQAGPAVITADQVKVQKTDKGWTCTAQKQLNFQGTAQFDANGKVTAVSKFSIAPLPPSARPRGPGGPR